MSFLTATQGAIYRHGLDLVYTQVTTGAYNVETGQPSITTTSYVCRMYPKHITANQYNYPTMIGKDLVMFYLANSELAFTIKENDTITYRSKIYKIRSYQEHMANGSVTLYRIVAVAG